MLVHRDINQLPKFENTVITIGSFDGIHIGHKKILAEINALARKINGESLIITFHPHPRKLVMTEPNIGILTSLNEKINILEQQKVDHLVVVPFNREFSNQSANTYIENFLIKNFNPKIIVIGYNHKYGKNRVGDIDLLKSYKEKFDFDVYVITKQQQENLKLSSSEIRNYLREGKIRNANKLLGYSYFFTGNVIKGDQIGRTIGFPTANIQLSVKEKLLPKNGIYACCVKRNNKTYKAMLYIGTRPVLNEKKLSIEVNIFDFDASIYGEFLVVELIQFIRNDENLSSLNDLKQKLTEDKVNALEILSNLKI